MSYKDKMNRYSPLYLLGYTTTKCSHIRRCVLERGVEELGLQKVIDIIYMSIKRGLTKNKPPELAIDKWISDLDWLRRIYFLSEERVFWPETYEGFGEQHA